VLTGLIFVALVYTLLIIVRNLTNDAWPPVKRPRGIDARTRPSFDINDVRDGSSWVTSTVRSHSRRTSFASAWSFSSYNTANVPNLAAASDPSLPAKSSFWFNPVAESTVPPVPPLPSPYKHANEEERRRHGVVSARQRLGSNTSWLTSEGSHGTPSAWSYPTTATPQASTYDLGADLLRKTPSPLPQPAAMASAQVLGGYGYVAPSPDVEKGLQVLSKDPNVDMSIYHLLTWLVLILLPFVSIDCL
jgi:hypothetical protein